MRQRQQLLETIAKSICEIPSPFVTRVAIDGVDGADKTIFPGELFKVLDFRQNYYSCIC